MKFLIHTTQACSEQLDLIANGLNSQGHGTFGFNDNIYRAFNEQTPDCLVLTEESLKNPDFRRFIETNKPKFLTVQGEKLSYSDEKSIHLSGFANTIKYKPELPLYDFSCDVGIIFDGNRPEIVYDAYARLYENYTVKIVGAFINCPGFIGMGTIQDVVKLGKSAKIVICTNPITANSLIYNNVCSVYNMPNPESLLSQSAEIIENLILDTKQSIKTERELGYGILQLIK